jgi:hypothetical protein
MLNAEGGMENVECKMQNEETRSLHFTFCILHFEVTVDRRIDKQSKTIRRRSPSLGVVKLSLPNGGIFARWMV